METNTVILNPKTSASVIEGFFFDTSLYVEKPFNEVGFLTNNTKIDGYCIHCKKERTFQIEKLIRISKHNNESRLVYFHTSDRRAQVYKLHCAKDIRHAYVYIIEAKEEKGKGLKLKKLDKSPQSLTSHLLTFPILKIS